jgi:hypothetical protein
VGPLLASEVGPLNVDIPIQPRSPGIVARSPTIEDVEVSAKAAKVAKPTGSPRPLGACCAGRPVFAAITVPCGPVCVQAVVEHQERQAKDPEGMLGPQLVVVVEVDVELLGEARHAQGGELPGGRVEVGEVVALTQAGPQLSGSCLWLP